MPPEVPFYVQLTVTRVSETQKTYGGDIFCFISITILCNKIVVLT